MVEGVRRSIGADTLGYISTEGMIAATEQPRSRLCCACFNGNYPIALPTEAAIGKNVLEGMLTGQSEAMLLSDNANASALSRP
jgi:amidophosphoribosyltransferase